MACARLFGGKKKLLSPEEEADKQARRIHKNQLRANYLIQMAEKMGYILPEKALREGKQDVAEDMRPLLGKH